MKRRYLILFAAIMVLAVTISMLGRAPSVERAAEAEASPLPVVELELAIRDGAIEPERIAVAKDHDVRLQVANHEAHRVHLELSGYADQVSVELDPGERWSGAFRSDRPGDDFAWTLDGRPAGRLNITGSHLIEGHQ